VHHGGKYLAVNNVSGINLKNYLSKREKMILILFTINKMKERKSKRE